MKLLILGATRGVGQQVLAQALEAGHDVTAFARARIRCRLTRGCASSPAT